LIAPAAGDVAEEVYAGAAGAEVVAVPRPDLEARTAFAADLKERYAGTAWEMTPDELAAETGGLGLVQMEDIVQRAGGTGRRCPGPPSWTARSTCCGRSTATCWRSSSRRTTSLPWAASTTRCAS
jgi:hypothetical protein